MLWLIKSFFLLLFSLLVFSGCSTKFGKSTYYKSSNSYAKKSTQKQPVKKAGKTKVTSHTLSQSDMNHPTMRPYKVLGQNYYPHDTHKGDIYEGIASWYGPDFNGKLTSNGEKYDMYAYTCAHKTLPMNTILQVKNKANGREVVVRVNDRGPFVKQRIIDLSKAAAYAIDMTKKGTAPVRLKVLGFYNPHTKSVIKTESREVSHTQKSASDRYYVQIGSFSRYEGAQEYKERYKQTEYNYSALIKERYVNGKSVYKVMLSGFSSEREAREFIANNSMFENAFLVKE